jgi:hypothetical protein
VASKECPPCEPSEAQKLKLELVKAKQQVILNEIIWRSRQAQIPELEQQAKALQIELAGAADAARKANGWPEGTTFDLQCFLAPRPPGVAPAEAHDCYSAPAKPEEKKK